MEDKVKEIVDLLDKADELFSSLAQGIEQANPLWESGIEKLSAALWLLEKLKRESMEPAQAVNTRMRIT